MGGSVQTIERNGADHSARLLPDPAPIVDFVLRQTLKYQSFMHLGAGVDRFRAAAGRGETTRVYFFGGSVAYNTGWQRFIKGDLIRAFPETKLEFVTSGVPSLDSTAQAFRVERDLLSRPPADLVFLESAIDDDNNGRSTADCIRGIEGCVRRLRRAWPDVDIVLLHFPSERVVTTWSKETERGAIVAHEAVAKHYGLPSLDMSAEFAGRIGRGEFSWKDYGGEEPATFGQRLIWRSMQRLFSALHATEPLEGAPDAQPLPAPMDVDSYAFGVQISPENATLASGWILTPQWIPNADEKGRDGFALRPTLEARAEGAELEFAFSGRSIGIQIVAGPDAGALAWSVDGGQPQTLGLHTAWSDRVHLPWFHVLATGLEEGEHVLTLRSLAVDGRSAARIQAFLVDRGATFAGLPGDLTGALPPILPPAPAAEQDGKEK